MLPAWMHQYVNSAMWGSTTAMASIALFSIGSALALGVGATMFWAGAISVGTVFLLYQYTEQIRQPLDRLRTLIDDFQKAGAGLVRVRALLGMSSRLPDTGSVQLPGGALAVELADLSFTYADDDSNTAVLHDVSLQLAPGRTLGLLGRTGSGKTTIARLLVRLYDVDRGCIRLAGRPITDISLSSLRSHVRLVTQDVQLFRATLRDNLTLFDGTIPDVAIWTALEEVGLAEWAAAFERQLDTPLDGDALSAGQAQLLALARVFLANPGLIILDEASARLDPATERLIRHAVDRLLRDRSGIIIAHRLATVRHVDDIAVLEDGRLVEFGSRAALEQDTGSRFARLLRSGGLVELLA
jgi:ABC-type multidrug transport system fused ATPase/permease subunit